jgi:hypothetical protein
MYILQYLKKTKNESVREGGAGLINPTLHIKMPEEEDFTN